MYLSFLNNLIGRSGRYMRCIIRKKRRRFSRREVKERSDTCLSKLLIDGRISHSGNLRKNFLLKEVDLELEETHFKERNLKINTSLGDISLLIYQRCLLKKIYSNKQAFQLRLLRLSWMKDNNLPIRCRFQVMTKKTAKMTSLKYR